MSKTKLTVTKNGFIKIDGDFEIVDQEETYTICKVEPL